MLTKIQLIMKAPLFLLLICLFSCDKETFPGIDFRQEMRDFVGEIGDYAKNADPDFAIVPQNGIELTSSSAYLAVIDGVGQEDLFFGYNKDDKATPEETSAYLTELLDAVKANGKAVLVTDYCSTPGNVDESYQKNQARGYISFAADRRELDQIPDYPENPNQENADSIGSLSQVKNFLYLLDPEPFSSKQTFIQAISSTNYDLLITDLFFKDGTAFTALELEQLRQKANGGKRLVICYMSIGEAEDYRYYWQSSWKNDPPEWLEKENPNWEGNYKVQYWHPEWQDLIKDYVQKILDAGFDGVYLDIIDGFEYFE
ncbi:MAG: endo alpha-1,4 polygalactosaminidase [Saprospirales bacterium]|nr:endo alpha-1,4 polygalactosaminidase [Saprospirales bacterium]